MTAYDVIVIGGGHNGLTAAALLAKRGRRVVLLERHGALGGLAAGGAFHPGFESVGLLHDTGGVRRHVVQMLELETHGLKLAAPPPVFAPQEPDDGPGLLLHHDAALAAGEIERHARADAHAYGGYRAFIDRTAPILHRVLDHEPPAFAGDGAASLLSLLGPGLALRRAGRADMMELLRVAPMCVADWLGEQFESELLRCALAAPALAGTTTGPWSPGTVANLLRLEALAGPAVQGGPGALVAALETAARRAGVDVRTEADVRRIRLDGGAVQGVALRDGETLDAPVVVSSCDPKQTFLELVEPAAIGPKLRHRIDKLRASGTAVKIDLAVRGELRFGCRPDLAIEHARIAGSIDDMERAFDAIKYGRCSEAPILDVYVPTVANPGLALDGHHVISIVAHFAPYDLRARWSDTERERFGDGVVATLDRYAPGIAGRIVAGRVLAPVDVARRYGVTGGHIHHVEHALDQMIVRPVPECAQHATPIRGLYLGGSGTHPGGGLTCAPGALAADAVIRGE